MGERERQTMEEKQEDSGASYRYWVREATADAAPPPLPRKLNPHDIAQSDSSNPPTLGSLWNRAGTWEEKSLTKWATDRLKELLISVGSLEFSSGSAEIKDVSRCVGDAFLITVRNKKRVGYTYEISLKFEGDWTFEDNKKKVKGTLDIPEFSFGELDDLQVDVSLIENSGLLQQQKQWICQDLKQFLEPIRMKLCLFERELKDR